MRVGYSFRVLLRVLDEWAVREPPLRPMMRFARPDAARTRPNAWSVRP